MPFICLILSMSHLRRRRCLSTGERVNPDTISALSATRSCDLESCLRMRLVSADRLCHNFWRFLLTLDFLHNTLLYQPIYTLSDLTFRSNSAPIFSIPAKGRVCEETVVGVFSRRHLQYLVGKSVTTSGAVCLATTVGPLYALTTRCPIWTNPWCRNI